MALTQNISLDHFVTFQRGYDLPKSKFIDGGVPVFGSTSIIGYHNEAKVTAPGVITGRSGTLGNFQYTEDDYWPHNTSLWVKDFKGNDPKFAFYLMQCLNFEDLNSGGAVPTLNRNVLKSFKVDVPNLETQKRIAVFLSAYDDLIENNLERIKLLEEMAQITYEEWFVHMKFLGHEKVEIDSDTELPKGWKNGCVTDICYVNSDNITAKNIPESIKYIDIASVNTGSYERPESMSFLSAPSRARRKVKFGDTIFSTVRPNRKTYSLILDDDKDLVASTGFAALRPKEEHFFSFVYLSVANQDFVDGTVAVAGGAAYPAVKQSDFERIKVIVPTQKLIEEFCSITNKLFEAISSLTKQNSLLKEARDILLPRLMTGMIDIDNVELPEALLERINK